MSRLFFLSQLYRQSVLFKVQHIQVQHKFWVANFETCNLRNLNFLIVSSKRAWRKAFLLIAGTDKISNWSHSTLKFPVKFEFWKWKILKNMKNIIKYFNKNFIFLNFEYFWKLLKRKSFPIFFLNCKEVFSQDFSTGGLIIRPCTKSPWGLINSHSGVKISKREVS